KIGLRRYEKTSTGPPPTSTGCPPTITGPPPTSTGIHVTASSMCAESVKAMNADAFNVQASH
ncbi:hypothetical protein HaLaN_28070, partial [Haematococcus lacustris]